MQKRILFIDTTHPVIREELEAHGFQCEFFPAYKRADFERIIHRYHGIIIRSKITLDKNMLEKAEQLEFIGRVGAGMENIDTEYAESHNIVCFNSPEGSRDAVGEHTLGLLLALARNIIRSDREVRQAEWNREKNRGFELKGKTIGIIGYGNMGSAFAEKLHGIGAEVIAYDKYKSAYGDNYVVETSLDEVFERSDVCSLHVPLTEETTYMVNRNFIDHFKKNIYLLNTARGKVLKTDDLVNAIKSGKVKGAALDVIEYEDMSFEKLGTEQLPYTFQFLINSDRVVMSPHIAGWTQESKYKLGKVLVDKIIELLKVKG
ncbi:MAG: hypothetical protein K9G67_11440 [Bacteroidales bacterium]|nr:hypothetical protein [Bacteroidales bacterium]MCF8343978.1 hypothetical protein [Bacteroidales bacterium]MCF8351109.1 hypothetical protein [Bacteroidales bacterium]MCF8376960.1 hypothetical protein [Bacteroidales bacterium]MCF8401302.1 hypothetical protein [Bacteroidales bacterium]